MNFKDPIYTYLGMAIAILAMITGVFEWFDPNIAWGIAGLFGFGSVASLRAYISSKGWKTYAAVIPPMILGVLTTLNVITIEVYQQLMLVFGAISGATIQHANKKANGK